MGQGNVESTDKYKFLDKYVDEFHAGRRSPKPEAYSIRMKNPLTGEETTLGDLIASLAGRYLSLRELVTALTRPKEKSDSLDHGLLELCLEYEKTANALLQAHNLALARGLIFDDLQKELDDLRKKNSTLESDFNKLKKEHQKLRENYRGLLKLMGTAESTLERDDRP
jgi:hypothetical protein